MIIIPKLMTVVNEENKEADGENRGQVMNIHEPDEQDTRHTKEHYRDKALSWKARHKSRLHTII